MHWHPSLGALLIIIITYFCLNAGRITVVCVLEINPDSHEIKRYLIIKSIQIVVDIYKRQMHGEEYWK